MRKFTVYTLLQYWAQAAFEQWDGYRDGADRAVTCGLYCTMMFDVIALYFCHSNISASPTI
ncbi:hypothetical protein M5X00_02765 [Paenibacillus alvei]|uniref:hypothetical protein n=1 Tax=Paenibacillus alvei TaxID=44250 RepID=UPI00227F2BC9|nr:hypothetical protein [Paenibacillus alvei]MCY9707167.1 hypothetical protein [Paenibacillus alvei]MCY9753184.1 hypothetical protein [Paenibacillus alvei]